MVKSMRNESTKEGVHEQLADSAKGAAKEREKREKLEDLLFEAFDFRDLEVGDRFYVSGLGCHMIDGVVCHYTDHEPVEFIYGSHLAIMALERFHVKAMNAEKGFMMEMSSEDCIFRKTERECWDALIGMAMDGARDCNGMIDELLGKKDAACNGEVQGSITAQGLFPGNKVNLCASCAQEIPECDSNGIVFGTGKGNDNVIACPNYSALIYRHDFTRSSSTTKDDEKVK